MAVAATACSTSGAGPTSRVAGVWMRGGVSGDHSGAYYLDLSQQGWTIGGTACRLDGGIVIFKRVPVHGTVPPRGGVPQITFTIPSTEASSLAGAMFVGVAHGEVISGDLLRPGGTQTALEYRPLAGTLPELCR